MSSVKHGWVVVAALVLLTGCAGNEQVVTTTRDLNWVNLNTEAWAKAKPAPEPKLLPMTHYSAGELLERRGDLPAAAEQYRRAVTLNPDFVQAHNRLGVVLDRLGKHGEAERSFLAGVERKPRAAYLHNNLGFCYLLQERWQDAEATLQEALRIKRGFRRARVNLAVALAKQGRFDQALQQLCRVLPTATAYYNMGVLCRGEQRYAEARRWLEQALVLDEGLELARVQLRELAVLSASLAPSTGPELAQAKALPPTAELALHEMSTAEPFEQLSPSPIIMQPPAPEPEQACDVAEAAGAQSGPWSIQPLWSLAQDALNVPTWRWVFDTLPVTDRERLARWVAAHRRWIEPVRLDPRDGKGVLETVRVARS